MLRILFPDINLQQMQVACGDTILPMNITIQDAPALPVWQIVFHTGTGFPVHDVFRSEPLTPMTVEVARSVQNRWVRSPFQHRASECPVPSCWTLAQLAGSFMLHTNATQTMMCLVDGKNTDPRTIIKDIPVELVVSLRVCALPGGSPESLNSAPQSDPCTGSAGSGSNGHNRTCPAKPNSSQEIVPEGIIQTPSTQIAIEHPISRAIHVATCSIQNTLITCINQAIEKFTVASVMDSCGTALNQSSSIGDCVDLGMQWVYVVGYLGTQLFTTFLVFHPGGDGDCPIFVKGPFSVHGQTILAHGGDHVMQVAMRTIPRCAKTIIITPVINGKLAGAHTLIRDLCPQAVLAFKLAQLPGGAPKKGDLKTKLRNILISHGVAESGADARVASVIQGVGFEQLRKHEAEDIDTFWLSIKKLASEQHIRLVTVAELREFQKTKRANTRAAAASAKPKSSKQPDAFKLPPLNDINVCTHHFVVDDEPVSVIPKERFGPDAAGMTIMGVQEAMGHTSTGCISMDPLAILAIGYRAEALGNKIMVPAHNKDGQPMLVPATLLQFGEGEVAFKAAVPSAETSMIDAITLEFTLKREFVGNWDATSTPMNFLGVQCPELRGPGKILSSWSVRAYKERKAVAFTEAQHWHGYLKLDARLVDSILKRSGQQGMFFTPRGSDKRPDSRYAVVPLPGRSLEQIKELIQDLPNALGVAVLGSDFKSFGVRCRKTHIEQMQKHFFPESVQIDSAEVSQDDQLWIIKHLNGQYTRDNMDKALEMVQWDARAIRSTGPTSWLVASAQPPPAEYICINGHLAVVIAKKIPQGSSVVLTRTDTVTQITGSPDGGCAMTTRSRIDEIQADIQGQVAALVEERLSATNTQIQTLSTALADTQKQLSEAQVEHQKQLDIVKADQVHTMTKVGDLETAINNNAGSILSQMKSMLEMFHTEQGKQIEVVQGNIRAQITGFQTDLNERIESLELEHNKRHKAGHDGSLL